jgi:hypothetical protein
MSLPSIPKATVSGRARVILLVLLLVVVAAAVPLVLYWSARPQPGIVAEATVWIFPSPARAASSAERWSLRDDYLPMHAALLKSPVMIDQAVKMHQLDALASLAGKDAAATIREGLSVTHDPSFPKSVLILQFRGTSPSDAEAVLKTLIDSYTVYLEKDAETTYKKHREVLQTANEDLQRYLAMAKKSYQEHLTMTGAGLPAEKALLEHEEMQKAVRQKKAAVVLRQAELTASLEWLEKARAAGQNLAVQLKAAA